MHLQTKCCKLSQWTDRNDPEILFWQCAFPTLLTADHRAEHEKHRDLDHTGAAGTNNSYQRRENCGRVVNIFLGEKTQHVPARTRVGVTVDTSSSYFQQNRYNLCTRKSVMVAYQGGVHIGGAGIVIVLLCVTNVMDGRLFYVYKIIFQGMKLKYMRAPLT